MNDNQCFWLKEVITVDGRILYSIRNVKDDLCLDVSGYGPVAPATKISEYYCNHSNADNQLYYVFDHYLYGDYTGSWFVNYKSQLCLDVEGYSSDVVDTRLALYTCSVYDDDHR